MDDEEYIAIPVSEYDYLKQCKEMCNGYYFLKEGGKK